MQNRIKVIVCCLAVIICAACVSPRREHFASSAMNILIVNGESYDSLPRNILNDINTVVVNKTNKPTGAPIEFFVGDPSATIDDMKLMASHIVPEIKKISVY